MRIGYVIERKKDMDLKNGISAKGILMYLSIKHSGDWDRIYADVKNKADVDGREIADAIAACPHRTVTILDPEYPAALGKGSVNPPFVLYVEGDERLLSVSRDRILTVAGAGEPSDYSADFARRVGKACAERGVVLCAKLVRGCAIEALDACANAGGRCIAVMSSGIDRPYPRSKEMLWTMSAILNAGGAVVSEYPDGTEPKPVGFVMSARIVGAMGKVMFVPELRANGASAMAVSFALNAGNDVAVLPTRADDGTANNSLIKEGAMLVDDPDEFLDLEYPSGKGGI